MKWWQGQVWGGKERRQRLVGWTVEQMRMLRGVYKTDLRENPFDVFKLGFDEGRLHEVMLFADLLQIRKVDIEW
jgi:hypothetical protein